MLLGKSISFLTVAECKGENARGIITRWPRLPLHSYNKQREGVVAL
jgi:hypothetical protein